MLVVQLQLVQVFVLVDWSRGAVRGGVAGIIVLAVDIIVLLASIILDWSAHGFAKQHPRICITAGFCNKIGSPSCDIPPHYHQLHTP